MGQSPAPLVSALVNLLARAAIDARLEARSGYAGAAVAVAAMLAIAEPGVVPDVAVSAESGTEGAQFGLSFDTEGSLGRFGAPSANSHHVWNDLSCLSCRPGSGLAGFALGCIVASPSHVSPGH